MILLSPFLFLKQTIAPITYFVNRFVGFFFFLFFVHMQPYLLPFLLRYSARVKMSLYTVYMVRYILLRESYNFRKRAHSFEITVRPLLMFSYIFSLPIPSVLLVPDGRQRTQAHGTTCGKIAGYDTDKYSKYDRCSYKPKRNIRQLPGTPHMPFCQSIHRE